MPPVGMEPRHSQPPPPPRGILSFFLGGGDIKNNPNPDADPLPTSGHSAAFSPTAGGGVGRGAALRYSPPPRRTSSPDAVIQRAHGTAGTGTAGTGTGAAPAAAFPRPAAPGTAPVLSHEARFSRRCPPAPLAEGRRAALPERCGAAMAPGHVGAGRQRQPSPERAGRSDQSNRWPREREGWRERERWRAERTAPTGRAGWGGTGGRAGCGGSGTMDTHGCAGVGLCVGMCTALSRRVRLKTDRGDFGLCAPC